MSSGKLDAPKQLEWKHHVHHVRKTIHWHEKKWVGHLVENVLTDVLVTSMMMMNRGNMQSGGIFLEDICVLYHACKPIVVAQKRT